MSGIKSFKILNLLEEERAGEHLLLKELKYSYWYLSKPPEKKIPINEGSHAKNSTLASKYFWGYRE